MASTREYLDYVLEQLSAPEEITYRPMMGEYILYVHGKVIGGIYDDRLLVKPIPAVQALMPDAPREIPYPGAKEMLLADNVDDRDFLCALLETMDRELPEKRSRRSR